MDLGGIRIHVSRRRPLHERGTHGHHRHRQRRRDQDLRSRSRHRETSQPLVISDEDPGVQNSSCIDLTSGDEEFIDLTSPTGSNDASVIIVSYIAKTRRRRPRRRRHRETSDESENDVIEISNSYHPLPLPLSFDDPETENKPSTSANDSILSPVQDISCPICMDSKKQIIKSGRQMAATVCGHVFCKPCIKASIDNHRFCPTCRKKLSMRQVHPLFI
ncbi:E3 ubiquitin-protein ligase RNF4-like isoform X2 [Saccostrea echinata]|uniref:E3 ubiquitin-protein ligase RNF4-like isoform X2 n=1 Tax=Saccostrea echinata TaxID=191078 RepID=UPI002A7F9C3D|nr:E3 ubiquitin-protein ligase RNF4-like isoform X2 [Saccostrea echinata]